MPQFLFRSEIARGCTACGAPAGAACRDQVGRIAGRPHQGRLSIPDAMARFAYDVGFSRSDVATLVPESNTDAVTQIGEYVDVP